MKKLLFSLFVIFSLFFINDSVFAVSLQDDLYLSQEKYYELSDFIEDNYGTGLSGNNGERCMQIWITHVYYGTDANGLDYMKKTYYVIQYKDLVWSFISSDDKHSWQLYLDNFVQIRIEEFYRDGVLDERVYAYEHTNEGKGWPHNNNILLKYLDNYSTTWGAFHFALSYDAIPIYTNDDFKDMYLFYNPDYNFDKNITDETLKTNPDQAYDDFYADTNKPNQNIFERIWGGIVNIFNAITSLPEKIGNILSSFFGGFTIDENVFKDKLNILIADIDKRFGFIYQTFDILIDVFNRFLHIESGNHVINIPEIREPISNHVIIEGTTFNFDYVLSKNNISYLHSIYLSFVDVIVLFSLIRYGLKQFNKIFGGGKQ